MILSFFVSSYGEIYGCDGGDWCWMLEKDENGTRVMFFLYLKWGRK